MEKLFFKAFVNASKQFTREAQKRICNGCRDDKLSQRDHECLDETTDKDWWNNQHYMELLKLTPRDDTLKELWHILYDQDTSEEATLKPTWFDILALWLERPFEKLEYCDKTKEEVKEMIYN